MAVFRDEHSLNNDIFTLTYCVESILVLKERVKCTIDKRFGQFFRVWKSENGKWEIVYGQEKFVTQNVAKSLLNSDQVFSDQVIKNFSSPDGEVRWGSTRRDFNSDQVFSDQVIKNFPLSNGEGRERVLPVGPELGGKLCYQ